MTAASIVTDSAARNREIGPIVGEIYAVTGISCDDVIGEHRIVHHTGSAIEIESRTIPTSL